MAFEWMVMERLTLVLHLGDEVEHEDEEEEVGRGGGSLKMMGRDGPNPLVQNIRYPSDTDIGWCTSSEKEKKLSETIGWIQILFNYLVFV